jgi:hypothetical protein
MLKNWNYISLEPKCLLVTHFLINWWIGEYVYWFISPSSIPVTMMSQQLIWVDWLNWSDTFDARGAESSEWRSGSEDPHWHQRKFFPKLKLYHLIEHHELSFINIKVLQQQKQLTASIILFLRYQVQMPLSWVIKRGLHLPYLYVGVLGLLSIVETWNKILLLFSYSWQFIRSWRRCENNWILLKF